MSSVSLSAPPIFLSLPSENQGGAPSTPQGATPQTNLQFNISKVFRRHVTDINKISPYESPAFSNYPGGTNLLYLPEDIYSSAKTLYKSLKDGDSEETHDASIRLLGAPANFISASGTLINYGVGLNLIPMKLIALIPFSYILGVVLCTVEGSLDIISLKREVRFCKRFDFDLLAKMNKLIQNFSPKESYKALKDINAKVQEHPKEFEKLFGKEQTNRIQKLFQNIKKEVDAKPLRYRKVLIKHAPALKEFSRHLLINNLVKLQRDYLELTPEEVMKVCQKTSKKFEGKTGTEQEQLEYLEKKLHKTLNIKKKKLARRVRPWMVAEAGQKTIPLLEGLLNNTPKAIEESLNLCEDIHTQTQKKTFVHILGIVALLFAAISLVTLIVGCAPAIPYILIGIATTIALVRMIAYITALDTRGWKVDFQALLPNFLKTKKTEEEKQELMDEFRTRQIVPMDQPYHRVKHFFKLDPKALAG